MPLGIGNYGKWEGDKPSDKAGQGYHPPACTCYHCIEAKRRAEEKAVASLLDAELRQRTKTPVPDKKPKKVKAPKAKKVKTPKPKKEKSPKSAPRPRQAQPETQNLAAPSAQVKAPDAPQNLTKPKTRDPARAGAVPKPRTKTTRDDYILGCVVPSVFVLTCLVLVGLAVYWVIGVFSGGGEADGSGNAEVAPLVSPSSLLQEPPENPKPTEMPLPAPADEISHVTTPPPEDQGPSFVRGVMDSTAMLAGDAVESAKPVMNGAVEGAEPFAKQAKRSTKRFGISVLGWASGAPHMDMAEVERWIVHYTNYERALYGRAPLRHDSAISEIARAHSENMASKRTLSHDLEGSPDRGRTSGLGCFGLGFGENIIEFPYEYEWPGDWEGDTIGDWKTASQSTNEENIAKEMVRSWMNSTGHRQNITDPKVRSIGVGVAPSGHDYFWATQNFSICR